MIGPIDDLEQTLDSTGASDAIVLDQPGEYMIYLRDPLGGAFSARVQCGDGTVADDVYLNGSVVTLAHGASQHAVVRGKLNYQIYVDSLTNDLSLSVFKV